MAKAKSKKTSAKSKATKPKRATKARKAGPLSTAARRALLKPRTGATDLAFEIATTWQSERGLRVDGLSAARLRSIALKARRSEARLIKLEEKHARQRQPVQDANLIAEDALWRALLDLRASVALRARNDATVEQRFASLIAALKNRAQPAAMPPVAPPTR